MIDYIKKLLMQNCLEQLQDFCFYVGVFVRPTYQY